MPTEAFLAVIAAALMHAGWNALVKGRSGSDPLSSSVAIATGAAVVALPCLLVTGLPGKASTWFIVASIGLHITYFTLMGLSYRAADYSVAYPLTRGTAPLGTAILGVIIVGEPLQPLAWLGIALLSFGVVALGSEGLLRKGLTLQGLGFVVLNIANVVAYTLVDGMGARLAGNAVAYVMLMHLLTGICLVPLALAARGPVVLADMRARAGLSLMAGAMVLAAYSTVMWAMTKAPIALVGALREISVLFATILAAVLLGERFGPVRWLASVAVVVGLVAIRLA